MIAVGALSKLSLKNSSILYLRTLMRTILFFIHETYEDLEFWVPKIRLNEAGFQTIVAGPEAGKVCSSKHGYPCKPDFSFAQIKGQNFDGVIIPGGFAPDKLRRIPEVLEAVKKAHEEKKLVAFICHGGWVPISARILKGKKATGTRAIKDDLENAGAIWHDNAVVVDANLVSSRTPDDLHLFCKAILEVLR